MSPLTFFIVFIISVTFIIARYALNKLEDPYGTNSSELLNQKNYIDYWKNAETTNGRLAMMGLLALVVNYGLFGWIIPGFF